MKTLGVPESAGECISQSPSTLTATTEDKYSQTHFQLRVWYISFLWNLRVKNGRERVSYKIQKKPEVTVGEASRHVVYPVHGSNSTVFSELVKRPSTFSL